jgi:hypothetical protein
MENNNKAMPCLLVSAYNVIFQNQNFHLIPQHLAFTNFCRHSAINNYVYHQRKFPPNLVSYIFGAIISVSMGAVQKKLQANYVSVIKILF